MNCHVAVRLIELCASFANEADKVATNAKNLATLLGKHITQLPSELLCGWEHTIFHRLMHIVEESTCWSLLFWDKTSVLMSCKHWDCRTHLLLWSSWSLWGSTKRRLFSVHFQCIGLRNNSNNLPKSVSPCCSAYSNWLSAPAHLCVFIWDANLQVFHTKDPHAQHSMCCRMLLPPFQFHDDKPGGVGPMQRERKWFELRLSCDPFCEKLSIHACFVWSKPASWLAASAELPC